MRWSRLWVLLLLLLPPAVHGCVTARRSIAAAVVQVGLHLITTELTHPRVISFLFGW